QTWVRWHKTGDTHRFEQPVGKQYTYGKGPEYSSELERLQAENRWKKNLTQNHPKRQLEKQVGTLCRKHKYRYGYRKITAILKMG
ncbi:IS3 family transposase, partial [Bacillus altitudinis]